ncbi:hypothetical protein Salat_2574100 [Sesamum alatum]|uniref:Uncharacterized protein n=1 Tax=Sesamum alatum TaxID=300844 RepID=A0AAE2CCV5_9LAMI|nr:hypothetical protein Salat_2574100 [Sesamum alatum]
MSMPLCWLGAYGWNGGLAAEEAKRQLEDLERTRKEKERKQEANLAHLKSKIIGLHARLEDSSLKPHEYPTIEEGKRVLEFVEAGHPLEPIPSNFLDIHAGLVDAPEPDEEVPSELPEILVWTNQGEEALEAPSD